MQTDKQYRALESRARRAAKRVGLRAIKSRKDHSLDNFGDFMLVDAAQNDVVCGSRFDLTADEVIECCAN